MRMDLERLKVFYVVAKEGGLLKASLKLNLTQPSLSRTIRLLEEELGTQLFDRTGKGLRLTTQGEKTLRFAEDILEKANSFEKMLYENPDRIEGEISIVTTPAVGETEITSFLLGFLEQYPQIRVKIKTKIEKINPNDADIAIRSYLPHQPDLNQFHLRTFHMKLWASAQYLNKFGTPLMPEDLDKHRVLVFEEDQYNPYSNTNWILHVGRNSENQSRKPFYQITSNEGLYKAALKGYGIVHLPKEYVKLQGSNLVEVLPDLEGPKIDVYFIFSKKLEKFKRIFVLYEYLHNCFEQL